MCHPDISCFIQLLQVIESRTSLVDSGECIDAIYLDFVTAFGAVPHQRLIKKLTAYGVHGEVSRWIEPS